MERIVVTRHPALVEYLKEIDVIDDNAKVIEHATRRDIWGKIAIGVLPIHLAEAAKKYICVPLDIPAELRGVELSLEQVRQYAQTPVAYKIETTKVFLNKTIHLDQATMAHLCEAHGDGLIKDFYVDIDDNPIDEPIPEVLQDKLDWKFLFKTTDYGESDFDYYAYELALYNPKTKEKYIGTQKLRLAWDDWSEMTFTQVIG